MPWFGKLLIMLMDPVFTLVGGALVFGRSWVTLNSSDRTVVTQVGLLMPMSTTTYRLDDYTTLLLGFQRGDSDSADQYPISLKARAGKNLRLFSSTQYAEARERAAAVASLFNLEIEDASTDHPVRLTAGQAHLSLQHRARLEHRRDEVVVRPPLIRAKSAKAWAASRSSFLHGAYIPRPSSSFCTDGGRDRLVRAVLPFLSGQPYP